MRSFTGSNITSISRRPVPTLTTSEAEELAYSSAITLSREETAEGFRGEVVRKYQRQLAPGVKMAHANTLEWVREKALDGIIFYNGRMDLTAGMLAACKQNQIPCITVERSLVGHGMWLVPNQNCLSLLEFDKMLEFYRDVPLSLEQAKLAASFLARRQLRESKLEWRAYNVEATDEAWPLGESSKVLVLPSSRNELEGNDEWNCDYTDMTQVLPRLLKELDVSSKSVVIRAHPLWASKVGGKLSSPAEDVWRKFAAQHGFYFIGSDAKTSTQNLIREADVVVLNGSSAAIEAGAVGKPIVCFGHSQYQNARLAIHIQSDNDWHKLENFGKQTPNEIVRMTLRFAYCVGWRFPQYVNYVRGLEPTAYHFYDGGNVDRITHMLKENTVLPDDAGYSTNNDAEDQIIAACLQNKWRELLIEEEVTAGMLEIGRRPLFRWVDDIRRLMPKGDA